MYEVGFFVTLLLPVAFLLFMIWRGKIKPDPPLVAPKAPASCPSCDGTVFIESDRRIVPAGDIRSFQFPIDGIATVSRFTCLKCGSTGRWGLAHEALQNGWILLGSQYLGY